VAEHNDTAMTLSTSAIASPPPSSPPAARFTKPVAQRLQRMIGQADFTIPSSSSLTIQAICCTITVLNHKRLTFVQ
jgi:hypothetical protein